MLVKVSWRNIWRNRKRSLIIMAAVAIGLWCGIFLMAFYNGMIRQRVDTAIYRELSHVQLHHPSFRADHDIRFILEQGHPMLEQVSADPAIQAATGRLILLGMIASANGSSGITVNGIMPDREDQVTGLKKKLFEGDYFSPEKRNEVLISQKTLEKLKLKRNKKVILTFQDKAGNLASGAFRVSGVFKTVNTPYDETNVFVDITDVDSLAGVRGALNEIAILLKDHDALDGVQQKLINQWPGTEILNWKEIAPDIGLTLSFGDQMVVIFMGIILLALAFGIVNTMLMAILERTREIGMLMALGMTKIKVFWMILLETFFLILAGCPVGILLALGTVWLTHQTGIDLSAMAGGEVYGTFGYDPRIYPVLRPDQFGTILILILITALLSSLLPARKALTLKPAQSIKK